jgi:LPXTG-motif cell wall-anchored protein
MFTLNSEKMKTKAGNVENCPATKTAKGLQVTLHGLSPVAIAWAEKNEPTPSPTPTPTASPTPTPTPTPTAKPTPTSKPVPKTGDSAPLALWLGLVLAGIICLGTVIAQMRRSRKKEET